MSELILRPNGIGASEQFAAVPGAGEDNWENVDEAIPDEGTTENRTAVQTVKDLYEIENSSKTGVINSVTLHARLRNWDGNAYKLQYGLRSGGTEDWNEEGLLGGAYANYSTVYNNDPNTSAAWIWAAINALQIGVNCFGLALWGGRVTQMYVVVDYEAEAGVGDKSASMGSKMVAAGLM